MTEQVQSYKEIESKVFNILDILRGEIGTRNFTVVLFFLHLKKDGYLSELVEADFSSLDLSLNKLVNHHESEHSETVKEIYTHFSESIGNLSERTLDAIIKLLLELEDYSFSYHYKALFENTLFKIAKATGKGSGEYVQPSELSKLIISLTGIVEGNFVYNPFAGCASFGAFLPDNVNYFAEELNSDSWAVGKLRLIASNNYEKSHLVITDSVKNWNSENLKYDVILSNPPFGLKSDRFESFSPINTIESFTVLRSLESLNTNGKLIVVLPMGFLFKSVDQHTREYLINNDYLETVISFPGGILSHTGIPICVLVVNKAKANKEEVVFINAESFVRTTGREKRINNKELIDVIENRVSSEFLKIVGNDEIRHQELNLNVNRYFLNEVDGVELSDLISIIRGPRVSKSLNGKFIRSRDLKNDRLDFRLSTDQIEDSNVPLAAYEFSESVLLLSTRWKALRATYLEVSDQSFFITSDIVTCKVNEELVDLSYLILELSADYVVEQLDKLRIDGTIPFIPKNDLLKVRIKLPSLELQKAQVKGARETILFQKQKETELYQKMHGLENEFHDQNSFLRHSIAGSLRNVRSSFKDLKYIIDNQLLSKIPELMNLTSNDKSKLTFGKHLEILERDIKKISTITKRVGTGLDILENPVMQAIDIFSFLRNYVNEVNNRENLIFLMEFKIDEEYLNTEGQLPELHIYADIHLLTVLLDNLVANAESHGFNHVKKPDNRIVIDLLPDCLISFSNTGKRLPSNFIREMFVRKGSKAGANAGDGIGGYLINEIIKIHDGKLVDIIDEDIEDLATTIEFEFPTIKI